MSVTSRFLKVFDPNSERHVLWLQKMTILAENLGGDMENIKKEINQNPMQLKLTELETLDWPHIHFVLAMAYAKAVLKGDAYIPTK